MCAIRIRNNETTEHAVELLPEANPVRQQAYKTGPKGRKFESEEVDRMLREGIVRPSTCKWAGPVVLWP